MHATRLQVLLYIPTKYYQSMSKGIKVMERTRMRLQFLLPARQLYITNKVRVVSLACNMPTGPSLHPYQILSNYLKQYGSYGLHKILASGENYIMKTVRVVSLARDMPTGPPLCSYQILSKYV